VLAIKSVKQNYSPSTEVLELLDLFRRMVNRCIVIGLSQNVSSLKSLCLLSYRELRGYPSPSCYKLCAVSRAAGILASRRKSLRRGFATKSPYAVKPLLISCYNFKIQNGHLQIPIGRKAYETIPLTKHTALVLSDKTLRVRSFTLTATTLSLCISKKVVTLECTGTVGVDRNLRNLTCGDEETVIQYDLSRAVEIANTTVSIVSSFKRNDRRIGQRLAMKYGKRRQNRTLNLLHNATKSIVDQAFEKKKAVVLESIRGIRRLYRKGNWQGRSFRGRMNSWSFGKAQSQIEYKAAWIGLSVVRLSRHETFGTSSTCPRCGERLQSDKNHRRQLWCPKCKVWMDRDLVAVINLSRRGRLRFDRSKGEAVEAVKGNPMPTVIPGVDASKPTYLAKVGRTMLSSTDYH
jgi:putative transposase